MAAPALRILVPVDGSVPSLLAVQHVVTLAQHGLPVDVHLLNVQRPVRGTSAVLFARADLEEYHRDEGMACLADADQAAAVAGMKAHLHVAVGVPGDVILVFARRLRVQMIVMGTRGYGGGVAGAIVGSVASDVVAGASVPVTLLGAA